MAVSVDFVGKDQVSKLIDKINARIKKGTDELKDQSKESEKLQRVASRLWDATRTPLERYNQTLANAKQALKGVEGGQETYSRVVQQANRKLLEQEIAAKKATGTVAQSNISTLATRWVSIASAIGLANRVLSEHAQLLEDAAQAERATAFSRGAFSQLPGRAENIALAERLTREGFAGTIKETQDFVFAAKSAGLKPESIETLASLRKTQIEEDVLGLGVAAKGFQKAFRGGDETGSVTAIIEKALATGETGTGTITGLTQAATKAAPAAKQLGLTDEETLAAIALLSGVVGTREAGTVARSTFTALAKKGIRGETISEVIGSAQKEGISATGLETVAATGFSNLAANIAQVEADSRRISAAQGSGVIGQRIAESLADPQQATLIRAQQAAGRRAVAQQPVATQQLDIQVERDRLIAKLLAEGRSGQAAVESFAFKTTDKIGFFKESAADIRERSIRLGVELTDETSVDVLRTISGQLNERQPPQMPQLEN